METPKCPQCGTDRFVSKRTYRDLQTVDASGKGVVVYCCADASGQSRRRTASGEIAADDFGGPTWQSCKSTTWGITSAGQVIAVTVTPPGDPLPDLDPLLDKIETAARALLA